MPCYDPGYNCHRQEYIRSEEDIKQVAKTNEEICHLQAIICALLSELNRRGIAEEVCIKASESGRVNVMDFCIRHHVTDKNRVARELHNRFSVDEYPILRELLDNLDESND
jgi:hypothetical protein